MSQIGLLDEVQTRLTYAVPADGLAGRSRRILSQEGICRGRSGLHRTRWWATPTRGDPRDQCHRKQTAPGFGGKGETVVQETTSALGDQHG